MACMVELFFLKPNCNGLVVRKGESIVFSKCSKTFEAMGEIVMPL